MARRNTKTKKETPVAGMKQQEQAHPERGNFIKEFDLADDSKKDLLANNEKLTKLGEAMQQIQSQAFVIREANNQVIRAISSTLGYSSDEYHVEVVPDEGLIKIYELNKK